MWTNSGKCIPGIYHVNSMVEMEDSREEPETEGPEQDGRKQSPEVLIVEDVYS